MTSEPEPIRPDELAALFERGGVEASLRCALAVSGGSDSTALMVLFADWLRRDGRDVGRHMVLTVDHALRPESAAEARAVAAQAARLGFQHVTLIWDGRKPQTGLQVAARSARYRLMRDSMQANGIALLLTGHTLDDQAETLLMRLARGSGLDGLAGMAPHLDFAALGFGHPAAGGLALARPLLAVARARLRATLNAKGIGWIEDPSNTSPLFERPRLRAARPHLEAIGLSDAMLALSAERLLRARRALDQVVDEFCSPAAGIVSVDPCGYITIDRARLQAAEAEIALRALGRAIAAAGGSGEWIPLAKLESMAAALRCSGSGAARWTLARALVSVQGRAVTVEREPGRAPLPDLELTAGAQACWDGRFWVSVGAGAGLGALTVRPLGEGSARELCRQGAVTARVPVRAMGTVPAFWDAGRLMAVPCLEYWADPKCRTVLQARFAWPGAIGNSLPGGPDRA
ncbi:MAG: tRNA lysidine(34) synthetase TilS [Hyphomonadaceae bacterium]|nr:tRNA lysidine(34) synthetase TilS [Hyphomonadaceae bacterium]